MIASAPRHLRAALFETLGDYASRRGAFGPLKLIAKSVRMAWYWRTQRAFLHSIGGPTTRQLLAMRPRMAFRPHSQCLFRKTNLRQRMRFLIGHYAFLNRVCDAAQFAEILEDRGVELWSMDSDERAVAIHLFGPPHHHEGDLALRLLADDVVIFQVAFSIVSCDCFDLPRPDTTNGCDVIYVGQVQGVSGQASRIRQTTQLCEAIAPQDLLMSALAGIAAAWGISVLLGVAAKRHLSIDRLMASPQAFDYTAFWMRYQATVSSDGHHVIDVPFPQKPIGEIVNRHRKRTLRKRRFKDALSKEVERTMSRSARALS